MSLFGRNVQAVTANSTTTAESTVGAPLGTFSQVKGGDTGTITPANSPNSHFGNTSAGTRANVDVQMYANDVPGAFISGQAVGVFGVTAGQMQNNVTNAAKDRPAHAGWVLRRAGTGPIISAAVNAPGSGFANGETITVSNAATNATLQITTNATGNSTSIAVLAGGSGFTNASMAAVAYNRQQHVLNVQTTGTGLQYDNTSLISVSNAAGFIVNGVVSISTNTTGGLTNASFTVTNVGLFSNTQTNAGLTFTVTNSTGGTTGIVGNTSVTGFNARLGTSTGGSVTLTLGGRANRVHTETLIAAGSIGSQTAGDGVAVTVANGLASGTTSQLYYPGS